MPIPIHRIARSARWLAVVFLTCVALVAASAWSGEPVRIGVLAVRSPAQDQAQWAPLAAALKAAMPERDFVVETLSLSEMEVAVASRKLDFALTNPAQYLLLAKKYGLSAPLATRATDLQGQRNTAYGGVIFTRAGERGINMLSDIRGKTVAVVDTESFASYGMQAYELLSGGVRAPEEVKLNPTGSPMDKVVESVLEGQADVGFVRSGWLEGMVSEGRLDMRRVKILNRQNLSGYPFAVSTRLYPEWPFSALPHADEELARDVTAALFRMQNGSPSMRVIGLRGFSVPADYAPVAEVLSALRLPPFEGAPAFTLQDVWNRYRAEVLGGLFALGLIMALGVYLAITKRRLEAEQRMVMRHNVFTRQLIETANVIVLGLDKTGRVVIFNARGEEVTGYPRQDLLGQDWFSIVALDERNDPAVAAFDESMGSSGPPPRERESVIRTRSGGVRRISWCNSMVLNPEGERISVSFGIDVTEQRQAEQELMESRNNLECHVAERTAELAMMADSLRGANARQQAILDAASAGIMLVRDRAIEQCNRRLEEIMGYIPGELTGRSTRVLFVDEASWRREGEDLYGDLARGKTYVTELVLQRKDGGTTWVRLSARAIDVTDPGRGTVCMVEDITEQRAAAEALRRASAEQQAILDSASSGIVLLKDRVAIRCNRRMHAMLHWPEGELVGKSSRAWYLDDAAFEQAGCDKIYEEVWRGLTHCREQLMVRRDGTQLWTRMTGRAIEAGDPAQGSVWVIDDITAELAAIAEITAARANAEDAARAKADFLANMSHEIRTPMNAVIGMTHLALKTDPTPRQRDYLLKIQRSSQHLLGLINDILDFSKIEAGKMALEHIDFELECLLDNVASLIADKTASKGLELVIDVARDVPRHLVGDPLRLSQVLINYANNAVKFTEKGEIAIRVGVEAWRGKELMLRFSVRDTGIGISEEQRASLFQTFQQVDPSTTRKYGGSGLGLVIAKRLAELMDGEVGVDSIQGAGSTFWFTARLGRGADSTLCLAPATDLFRRRVLLVDDNDTAREVISEMLRSLRFVVTAVASGPEALVELQRAAAVGEDYDIVFLDWQMPGIDGVMTAREIRSLPLKVAPHLLMITAGGRDELMLDAVQAGIEDVLIKPVNPSLLFDTVMRVLGQREAPPHFRPDESGAPRPDILTIAGARALLVEDNELNQEVASELLKDVGIETDVASNGAIALQKVQQKVYDIVLMDMQMPVMDGLSATREIRKLPALQALPIVALTANAMRGDRERCLEAGMNDHIAKPIEPEELNAKLLHWIGLRRRLAKPDDGERAPRGAVSGKSATGAHGAGRAPEAGLSPLAVQRVAGIPGLDAAKGLRLALGRDELYFSLLAKFVADQTNAPVQIADAIAIADWTSAERIAHTLKGVAGQIGAGEIQAIAGQVEEAVRSRLPGETLERLQAELAGALPVLVDAIAARLPSAEAQVVSQHAVQVDAEQFRAVCSLLMRQLSEDDFSCVRLLEVHKAMLVSALGEDFAEIAMEIEKYEFAGALERLMKALAARGVTL